MVKDIFMKLGLGKAEELVYMTLLEDGSSAAGVLARKTHFPRSSLYGYLETLHAKGFVRKSQRYDKKIWQAEPIETIGTLLQSDIESLTQIKESFLNALPNLQKKYAATFSVPVVTSFEGVEGMRQMFRDILLYHDIKTVAFWSIKDALQFLGQEFVTELIFKRAKNRISLRVIWPQEKMAEISQTPLLFNEDRLREIRIAPNSLVTSMGYWVYENKVSFISSKKEAFGFIVESAELAAMLRKQFEVFWEMSDPEGMLP